MLRRAIGLNERCIERHRHHQGANGGPITTILIDDLQTWLQDWMAAYDTIEGESR